MNINTPKRLYGFVITFLLCYFAFGQKGIRLGIASGFSFDARGVYVGASYLHNPDDLGVAVNTVLGIAMVMLIVDRKKKWGSVFPAKWFHILNILGLCTLVLLTGSRGAALAMTIVFLYAVLKSPKKVYLVILTALLVVSFWSLAPNMVRSRFMSTGTESDTTGNTRLTVWKYGLLVCLDYPIMGVGIGNNIEAARKLNPEIIHASHNIFMQAATESGMIGLSLFILILIQAFMYNRNTRQYLVDEPSNRFLYYMSHGMDLGLVGFIASGFFVTVLFYPFIWIHLAMCSTTLYLSKECRSNTTKRLETNHGG